MKIGFAGIIVIAVAGLAAQAQSPAPVRQEPPVPTGPPINSAPNPYRTVTGWFKVPEGRVFGSTGGVAVDKRNHVWGGERCGGRGFVPAPCAGSSLDPIFEFDQAGNLVHNFGGGLMIMPHGISIDA